MPEPEDCSADEIARLAIPTLTLDARHVRAFLRVPKAAAEAIIADAAVLTRAQRESFAWLLSRLPGDAARARRGRAIAVRLLTPLPSQNSARQVHLVRG